MNNGLEFVWEVIISTSKASVILILKHLNGASLNKEIEERKKDKNWTYIKDSNITNVVIVYWKIKQESVLCLFWGKQKS